MLSITTQECLDLYGELIFLNGFLKGIGKEPVRLDSLEKFIGNLRVEISQ